MEKYIVKFEFLNKFGRFMEDCLDNNKTGYTKEEAENVLDKEYPLMI